MSVRSRLPGKLHRIISGCHRTCPLYYFIILELLIDASKGISQVEINNHLELGKQFLAKGQLGDALTQYHSAVDGDPTNYLTFFKRGTVYLALGKAKNALADFDQVLSLKPDFTSARISRGTIHFKQAEFDLAQLDYYNVLKFDPHNIEANDLLQRVDPTKEKKKLAEYYYGHNDFANAIVMLNEVIEASPWAASLYEFRADLYLEINDPLSAIADYKAATKLQADNTEGYFKLASLLYELGFAVDALKSIRECLKLDPEHKDCFPFYKKIKKVEKRLSEAQGHLDEKRYAECIESAQKALEIESEEQMIVFEAKSFLCTCFSKDEQSSDALLICTEALQLSQRASLYCDRADAYIQSELFDDAIRDYKQALELDEHYDRAKEGVDRAQKLQKQSERRDYYKILEVKRTATKREIVKAYRKMAQKWHPDNFQNDEKMKKVAEKKFIDIAAAKEVLTDEEKRRQFDGGEDPLDPESGKGPGARGFQFHHFHGSPFQFQFHFN